MKTNKIIIVFLLVMLSPYWGLKLALKSEMLTKSILSYVEKTVLKGKEIKLSGESIEISFLFFETTIKNLSVEIQQKKLIERTDIGLRFSPQDFLKKNLRVGKMSIDSGVFNVDALPRGKSNSERLDFGELLNSLPFRNVEVNNLTVNSHDENFSALLNHIDFIKKKNKFILKLNGERIRYQESSFDVVKIEGELKNNLFLMKGSALKGVSYFDLGELKLDLKKFSGGGSFEFNLLGIDVGDAIGRKKIPGKHLEISGNGRFDIQKNKINSGDLTLKIESPAKSYLDVSSLDLSLKYNENLVTVEKLSVKNFEPKQKAESKPKQSFGEIVRKFSYDLEGNALIDDVIIKLDSFNIDTQQSFFADLMSTPITVDMSGLIKLGAEEKTRVDFKNLNFNHFGLGKKSEDLFLQNFNVNGDITTKDDDKSKLDLKIRSKKSSLDVVGFISSENVELKSKNSVVSLDEFKHFSGVGVAGESEGELSFVMDEDSSLLNYTISGRDLLVADYYIGDSKGELSIDFKKNKLKISNLASSIKTSLLEINAMFDLKSGGDYEINGTSKNLNSLAVKSILKNNFKEAIDSAGSVDFRGHSAFSIGGNYDGGFNLDLKISGGFFKYGIESFDNFEIDLKVGDNTIALNPFVLKKDSSSVFASGNFNYKRDILDIKLSGEDLEIDKFNFIKKYFPKTNGSLSLRLEHEGALESGAGVLDFSLRDFGNTDVNYKLSRFKVKKDGPELDIEGDLFDDQVRFSSFFDVLSNKRSQIDLKVDVPELDKLLSVYHPELGGEKQVESQVSFFVSSDFYLNKIESANLNMSISDLYLRRKNTDMYIQYPFNEINITNGKIKHGALKLFGGEHFLNFFIEGKRIEKSKILLESKLDADLFELIIPSTLGVSLSGDLFLFGTFNYIDHLFLNYNLELKDTTFNSSLYNKSLSGIDLSLSGDSSSIYLETASANFGGGSMNLSGLAMLGRKGVSLDFDIDLFDIKSKLLNNSFASVDFKGGVSGEGIPYGIFGALKLKDVRLSESVNDWVSLFNKKSSSTKKELLFKNNFIVESEKPLRIKNNLMDILVDSRLRLRGNNLSPKVEGELRIVPQSSKVFLKGNMFSVTDGSVSLRRSSGAPDPYFDINAETKIDTYNLKSSIVGDLKNLNINFISDPPLAQEDIFSLLAIGVTLKKTRNLGANAINNVTSLGLGSFLLDQTGINNSLDETLGVKVSIAPEIINDETSLLEGKVNQGVNNAQSRVRSATKIRLTKRISNSLDMSYSSTLGGSLDQRQEMNLNLKVDKNIMIQGVYQTQSSDNSENTDTTNSLGLDLIWKKTFK